MQKKLLRTYLLIIITTLLITVFFSWSKVKNYFIDRVTVENTAQILLLRDVIDGSVSDDVNDSKDFVSKYSEKIGARITIINENGDVIADSDKDPSDMDNHRNREEVKKVFDTGKISSSFRFSSTLDGYYQYVAVPITMNDEFFVLRLAKPIEEINKMIFDMIATIALGIIIGAVIAFVIAYFFTRRFMQPIHRLKDTALKISEGQYDEEIYIHEPDEIGKLADAFRAMTITLRMNLFQLEEKNAEMQAILESLSNGIMAISPDFKIMMFNDRFLTLFDIHEQEIIGKLFYEVSRNLLIFELIEETFETYEMSVKEASIHVQDKDKKYLVYANPIRSQTDKTQMLGVLLVVQDVTKIRKLESVRSDFVSNVTHELKTPLTSIRGFVDTLKEGALEEPDVAHKFLDIIDIEAERLEGLIADILILSEIEGMFGEKNMGSYVPMRIVQEVYDLLSPEATKKGIQLIIETAEGVNEFKCNKDRIKQLLINLVSNAIRYTDQGKVTIGIYEEYNHLILSVEDTGIGIEQKHLPRLFERFYRVDRGRSRTTGGTGLGLSIVKHIVELYNGKIKVESKVSVGTKFTVHLPYTK